MILARRQFRLEKNYGKRLGHVEIGEDNLFEL